MPSGTTVATIAELNAAIVAADSLAANSGTYTIALSNSITLSSTALEAINLNTGNVLDIAGGGYSLVGGGTTTPERGLFVYAGTVDIGNLTLANFDAVGGAGGSQGGGGAGLGGGLFVGSNVAGDAGNVTLSNVTFSGDTATGGKGGFTSKPGGGGGLGGAGGDSQGYIGGGGGGLGGSGGGGIFFGAGHAGSAGIVPRGGQAGSGSASGSGGGGGAGGLSGGGGGGGGGTSGGGGGGGIGGQNAPSPAQGGAGGFGGGGGSSFIRIGGAGGFGGGGGGGDTGGGGGFGGGGGGGAVKAGAAGFGGGAALGGGGGLGAGGDIFVQQGASLTILAGSLGTGTVTGGSSSGGSGNGSAFGNGIFIQGNQAVTLAPGTGNTLTVAGVIADQNGAWFGQGHTTSAAGTSADGTSNAGIGTLVVGAGLVQLAAANTFAGAVVVNGGTLEIGADAALGIDSVGGTADPNSLSLTGGATLNFSAGFTLTHNIAVSGAPTFVVQPGSVDTIAGTIADGGSAGNVVLTGGGTLVLAGVNTYTGGTTLEAGTLQVNSVANLGSGAITMAGTAAVLSVTGTQTNGGTFVNALSNFNNAGTIDLTAVAFVAGASATLSGTVLTLTDGGFTEQFTLAAAAPGSRYVVTSDAVGGTAITDVCFLRGTRIATPDGERRIEDLSPGDTVVTLSGAARPIVWIGKGKVLATRGRRSAATPVLVKKGAFADNVPNADLRVTRAHSFYLDEVLIPAEFLVNHRSILWDDRAQEVEIHHIELETHDAIFANGALAETYRDDGNRWLFQNANNGWGLPSQEPFAPVLTGGPVVDLVWMRLLDRSGQRPGLSLTDDPDLHLLVDGIRLDPAETAGPERAFFIPGTPESIQIVSRDAVPAELGLARDPRSLGMALRRIALRRGRASVEVQAGDPALTEGFHAYEATGDLRWTDGCATLPPGLVPEGCGALRLVLTLGGSARYPDMGEGTAFRAA